MGRSCVVLGCASRAERGTKRFFRIPAVILRQGDNILKLSSERRRLWLEAINRQDFTPTRYHCYVCSDHFVGGQPADLMQRDNPDWIPTMKLGNGPEPAACFGRHLKRYQGGISKTHLEAAVEPELEDPLDTSADCNNLYPTICVKSEIIAKGPGNTSMCVDSCSDLPVGNICQIYNCVSNIKKEPEVDYEAEDWIGSSSEFIQDVSCASACSQESDDQRSRQQTCDNKLLERLNQLELALAESQKNKKVLEDKLRWTQKELRAKQIRIDELHILPELKSERNSAGKVCCGELHDKCVRLEAELAESRNAVMLLHDRLSKSEDETKSKNKCIKELEMKLSYLKDALSTARGGNNMLKDG